MDLSIVIPAYNEEKRISSTLINYHNYFYAIYKNNFEILVIINGTKDKTEEIVKALSKKFKNIQSRNYPGKIGKGGAVIEGFKIANGALIGFVDADMATPPNAFNDLIHNIRNNDGIVASRWSKQSIINKKQPIRRRIVSRIFNIFVRILFNIQITDTQCGAKLFRSKAVKSTVNLLGVTQWGFDVDLLYQMRKNNFKIVEIPTVWHDQEGSKLKLVKTSYQMFLSMIRLRLLYSRFKFLVNTYDIIHDTLYKK